MKKNHKNGFHELKKHATIVFVIALIFALVASMIKYNFSIAAVRASIVSYGSWAPLILLIFIILTSSIGFIFPIPVAISSLLLDMRLAFFVSVVGLTVGAAISFFIARFIGREYVEKKFVNKIKHIREYDRRLRNDGFLTILFLRLITIIPYEAVNIAAGLSQIRFWTYMLGTFIGILPGTLIAIFFFRSTENLWSMHFIYASLITTTLSLLPLLSKKVRKLVFIE